MTTSKSLPDRPSLESLRKRAKKLARDISSGDAEAIARARVQLPDADLPLTQCNVQLVIARAHANNSTALILPSSNAKGMLPADL